ncbi:MAG TPA: hypothetical protein PKA80_07590 [Ignavibacteriaceae bacterium]|nr:hypothetical protein [Ignavibacteriaceae bacterium]
MKHVKIFLIVLLLSSDSFPQHYNFFIDSDNTVYYDPSWLFKTPTQTFIFINCELLIKFK